MILRFNRRAYYALILDAILFSVWLISADTLMLGLWISILLVIIIELITTKYAITGLELKRISKINRQKVGALFQETFEIKNGSEFTKQFIEVMDRSKVGKKINSRVISNLKPGATRKHISTAILLKRGIFKLGPTVLQSSGLMGLFTSKRTLEPVKRLIVYPYYFHIKHIKRTPSFEMGGENLWTYSPLTTPQVASVREYQPGDPLNRVHWAITLKHGNLMVKEFDEDCNAQTWVLLDACMERNTKKGIEIFAQNYRFASIKKGGSKYSMPCDSFEYAVSIAASIVNYYIENELTVGITAVGDEIINIQPEKGQRQFTKILEKLATIKDLGELDAPTMFERIKARIPKGSTVFLITSDKKLDFGLMQRSAILKKLILMPILLDVDTFKGEFRMNKDQIKNNITNNNVLTISFGEDIKNRIENWSI